MGEFYVDTIEANLMDLRRGLRRARWTAKTVHVLPLAGLAAVLAVAENLLSATTWWAALMVGLSVFVVVDQVLVERLVGPIIEARQRRILDRAAATLGTVGFAAFVAAVSREDPS